VPNRSTFGKYVLLRKLASGGMGEIFLAKQRGPSGFEKLLVIKRILSHHLDKKDYLDMFFSEAKLVARLNHNNIIQIHEMGEIDGDYYIAMEYVRGKSLRDMIDELRAEGRKLPLPHVIDLAMKLCDGLGYAHQARDIRGHPMNIVHRDINPHNILISYTGDLKLIDFGIAKSEMTSVHTATGTIKGKFVYMSPEQSAADPIDRRSDIFSLGIVIYEMCCLENPFVRQNVVLSLEAIQRHDVAPPSAKRADAEPLDSILMKALAKKPEDRFQTAIEMRDELRGLFRLSAVTPAEEDLSSFLHDLFRADIEEEDRLLAEADQATSTAFDEANTAPKPKAASNKITPQPLLSDAALPQQRTPQPIATNPFADEEPTLAGDLDEYAERSREISNVSGELNRPANIPSASGEMLPDFPTRSDRLPKNGSISRPDGLELGPDGLPLPGAISPGLMASLAPREASELFPVKQSASQSSAPRSVLPYVPPQGGIEAHLADEAPVANFSEPLHGLEPTREMKKGESILDAPRPTPPPPLHQYTTDEDSAGSLAQPPPPWKRVVRLAIYLLVLVVTTVAGFLATRAVIGPRDDGLDAPIAPIAEDEPLVEPSETQALGQPADEVIEVVEEPPPPAPPPPPSAIEEEDADETEVFDPRSKRTIKKKKKKKKTRVEVAPPPPPPRKKEPPPPPPPAEDPDVKRRVVVADDKPEASEKLGTLTVRASIGIKVEVDGRAQGSTPASIVVRRGSGRVKLYGDAIPYAVVLNFEVKDDGVAVKVDSSPWSIVKYNGLSLGRTPQGPVEAGLRHRFSLLKPGQNEPFVVSLLWTAKK
jgi:serine/threonine-protein kinase